MHAVMGVGLVGLVGKVHKWDESAMFFDGSSLGECTRPSRRRSRDQLPSVRLSPQRVPVPPPRHTIAAFVFAISVYLSVGVPACRTIATPVEGVDTREDQIEALRILSAGNTIIIVLLGAVLALQVRPPSPCHPLM